VPNVSDASGRQPACSGLAATPLDFDLRFDWRRSQPWAWYCARPLEWYLTRRVAQLSKLLCHRITGVVMVSAKIFLISWTRSRSQRFPQIEGSSVYDKPRCNRLRRNSLNGKWRWFGGTIDKRDALPTGSLASAPPAFGSRGRTRPDLSDKSSPERFAFSGSDEKRPAPKVQSLPQAGPPAVHAAD